MSAHNDLIIGRLDSAEAQASNFGDVVDVKASVVLVVLTFFGQLIASLLESDPTGAIRWLALASAAATTVSGLVALVELWPRSHAYEAVEGLQGWIEELRSFYATTEDADTKVQQTIAAGQIKRTSERLARQQRINDQKSKLLQWSFRAMGAAVALGLMALTLKAIG